MSDTILVSTHRLELAGRLRAAFEKEGQPVDLVPSAAHLDVARNVGLLVLTGAQGSEPLADWLHIAEQKRVPVFTALPHEVSLSAAGRVVVVEALGPEPDPTEMALLAKRALQRRRLQQETGILGESEPIREVLERVLQMAPVDSTVLVTGESGTGKELVARGIHQLSPRRGRSFLAVNVAALSETLLESELFGHEKGAFTGAIDSRKGFFELAHGGTLFLDEIGEMPLSTQTKLLRVLEQREFLRVGGEKPIRVDVRIIAATNQDLRELVPAGHFRRDLYYRLNILGIQLPPLRERRDDIPQLVRHFTNEVAERMGREFPGISDDAMDLLVRYDWPGNVRELRNLVESMVVMSPGQQIDADDIPDEIRLPGRSRRMLPVPFSPPASHKSEGDEREDETGRRIRPELEFVFRTLVELRMDMDQLRREFEIYRGETNDRLEYASVAPLAISSGGYGGEAEASEGRVDAKPPEAEAPARLSDDASEEEEPREHGPIVFRPGMTMDDVEREAIRAMLREVDGNRRKAAESLGIGERTLYRKIRKYGIEE